MHLRGIDTNLLAPLHALLHERSVTRAARRLGVGQPSMSHALARLRVQLGDPLLARSGRALLLTERAAALIEPVDLAVVQLERVFGPPVAFDPGVSQRVFRIASTDNLELYLLPRLARLLADEAPGVTLRMQHLSASWASALESGDIDLKLGRMDRVPPGLRSQALLDEELTCVVGRGHAKLPARPSLAQFAALRHVLVAPTLSPSDAAGGHVDALLARHGLERRVAVVVQHFLVAPFIVAESHLALTASRRLLAPFVRSLHLRPVRLPAKLAAYRLSQVWAERAHADPAHLWLRAAIARVLDAGRGPGRQRPGIDRVDGSHGHSL